MQTNCDFCAYNEYDEEEDEYYCSVNMDEDDMARFDAKVEEMVKQFDSNPCVLSGNKVTVI